MKAFPSRMEVNLAWRLKRIWRDHTYLRGRHTGETHEAAPQWSAAREGYDTYPTGVDSSNELVNGQVAKSLEDLHEHLSRGRGVRCIIPTTGDTPILSGGFQALFEQG